MHVCCSTSMPQGSCPHDTERWTQAGTRISRNVMYVTFPSTGTRLFRRKYCPLSPRETGVKQGERGGPSNKKHPAIRRANPPPRPTPDPPGVGDPLQSAAVAVSRRDKFPHMSPA